MRKKPIFRIFGWPELEPIGLHRLEFDRNLNYILIINIIF